MLLVGFNRRFAPQVRKIKELVQTISEPKSLIMTINAGVLPPDHWTHDPQRGGGRLIGEACHFIDLLRYLVGHPIESTSATMIGTAPGAPVRDDKVSFTMAFVDRSFGTVRYLANGHRAFPKERIEVFAQGRIL